jgi:hypothetical protein
MPAARAAATSAAAVMPQSTVMASSVPRLRSSSTEPMESPYPSPMRSGISQSHSAPRRRSVATRIEVEVTPSTS